MNIYGRYFKISEGPAFDELKRLRAIIKQAQKEYSEIVKEMGAEEGYWHTDNKLIAVTFKGAVDRDLFKKVRKGWYPKKTHSKSKAWHQRLEVVEVAKQDDLLPLVGLSSRSFWLVSGGMIHVPTTTVIPNPLTLYLRIPWYDEDPEKLAAYKADPKAHQDLDGNAEALLWEPLPEMVEVKEWEMLKAVDEFNATVGEGP